MIVKIYCLLLSAIIAINAQTTEDNSEVKTCYTTSGAEGECVLYYLCQNGKIITDGTGLIDTRTVGGCQDYFDECCEPEKKHTHEESVTVKRNATYEAVCGMRNSNGVLLEDLTDPVNGESQYGEFPWMAALLEKESISESFEKSYKCGGSLIGKNVVLTAAHCVKNNSPNDLIVRFGEWDSEKAYELFPHADHEVDKIVMHEKFYAPAVHNDVALLFLKTEVTFAETIDTICLPTQDQPIDMTRCFATGWGKSKFGYEEDEKKHVSLPKILKKIELPTVEHGDCQTKMRRTRLGRRFILDNSFMCAGGEEGIDTCKGDGGSPLVCPVAGVENQYYQAGIVAWGVGCGGKDVPGIYVNVAKFTNWINEKIALNVNS
jgi:secreted trypsin-like serine protease